MLVLQFYLWLCCFVEYAKLTSNYLVAVTTVLTH